MVKGAGLSLCKTAPLSGRKGNSGGDGIMFLQKQTFLSVLQKGRTCPRKRPGMDFGMGSEGLLAFNDFSQMNVSLPGGGGTGEEFLVHGTIHNPKH